MQMRLDIVVQMNKVAGYPEPSNVPKQFNSGFSA
jgi:hypothetical protein